MPSKPTCPGKQQLEKRSLSNPTQGSSACERQGLKEAPESAAVPQGRVWQSATSLESFWAQHANRSTNYKISASENAVKPCSLV